MDRTYVRKEGSVMDGCGMWMCVCVCVCVCVCCVIQPSALQTAEVAVTWLTFFTVKFTQRGSLIFVLTALFVVPVAQRLLCAGGTILLSCRRKLVTETWGSCGALGLVTPAVPYQHYLPCCRRTWGTHRFTQLNNPLVFKRSLSIFNQSLPSHETPIDSNRVEVVNGKKENGLLASGSSSGTIDKGGVYSLRASYKQQWPRKL